MQHLARAALFTTIGLALLLAAIGAVLFGSLTVAEIHQPFAHALAVAAELVAGILLLVAAVYLITRFAAWLFGQKPSSSHT